MAPKQYHGCIRMQKCVFQFQKFLYYFSSKSKTQDNLNCKPLQIKPQVTYIPHTMVQNYPSERKEWVYSGKILYQNKTKSQKGKCQILYDQVQCQNCWDGCQSLKLCTSNMLLSLGLVPIPVIRSPWQIYYTSGISNIWGGHQCNPDFTFIASSYGLQGSSSRYSSTIHCLASVAFWNCRGRFHDPFTLSSFMILKPPTHGWHSTSAASWGWTLLELYYAF